MEKKLDGNYTRMLWAIFNKSWRHHPTKQQLYGHLSRARKLSKLDENRWRSRDDLVRDILLSTPSHGRAKAGRPARTYIQQLCADTGYSPEDRPKAMDDRDGWQESVWNIRADSVTWGWYIYMLFDNGPGDRGSIPDQVIPKTPKMVLDSALLNT